MSRPTLRLRSWTLRWALLMALWIALTGKVTLQELVAGLIVSALGAGFSGLIAASVPAGPRAGGGRLGRQLLDPLVRLPADTGLLALAIWRRLRHGRPLRGSLLVERLEGDRVLTEWWGSLAPNRYVIGVDEEARTVLIHELVSTEEEARG